MRFKLTSNFRYFGLASSVFLTWSGFAYVAQAKIPDKVEALIENHCLNCHDAEAPKADFNLTELPRDLSKSKTLSTWVRLFDRLDKKEMPPGEKAHRINTEERDLALKLLGDALRQADRAEIARNHRGPVRRLTRDEFQDNLRDLLKMPTLDVKDKLPEDRRAHGFTKVAGLLDLSSFAKFDIQGEDATSFLNRLCANRIPKKTGGISLVHLLTDLGGIECEGTVARLSKDVFYFCALE